MATAETSGAVEADIVPPCQRDTGQFAQGMRPAVAAHICFSLKNWDGVRSSLEVSRKQSESYIQ